MITHTNNNPASIFWTGILKNFPDNSNVLVVEVMK